MRFKSFCKAFATCLKKPLMVQGDAYCFETAVCAFRGEPESVVRLPGRLKLCSPAHWPTKPSVPRHVVMTGMKHQDSWKAPLKSKLERGVRSTRKRLNLLGLSDVKQVRLVPFQEALGSGWLCGAAMAVVLVIGASRLFDPFSGDQALFLVGAKTLHAGGILYRDYWDIKQPGVFVFYLVAGTLFGFTQLGTHVLELVWQTTFGLALMFGLSGALKDSRWAAFAPLGVVAATYAGSSPWHLLQVEELVGLPIFVCILAADAATRRRSVNDRLVLVSGIAAGIVLLFKIVLLPVVIAVTVAVTFRRRANTSGIGPTHFWLIWLLGVLAPLAMYVLYAFATGTASLAFQTTFLIPFDILARVPVAPLARLDDSAMRLLLYFRGIIVLAVIGLATMRNQAMRPWRGACIMWIISGLAVILTQRQSWWQYQFVLLVPPIGVLSTFGVAFLGERVARGRIGGLAALAACGVVAYIAVPLPQGAIDTVTRVVRERPFRSAVALENYRAATSTEYADAVVDAQFPRRVTRQPGAIYVFGNPLIYVISNRPQAIAMTNWASYLDPPYIWKRLDSELSATRPNYIFVLRERKSDVSSVRSPLVAATLSRDYLKAALEPNGTWYRRRLLETITPH